MIKHPGKKFSNPIAAIRLLRWLATRPKCWGFTLDNEIFATRPYTGRK